MIDHKNKLIFIHIPKCAGSTIERIFGTYPFKWDEVDYDKLVGWDKETNIHLQHATCQEIVDNNYIDKNIWDEYTKFTVIRNPWSRVISDYHFMKKQWMNDKERINNAPLKDYLNNDGRFKDVLTDKTSLLYRGDHKTSLYDYLHIDDKLVVDHIIRFENLQSDFIEFCKKFNININTKLKMTKPGHWGSNYKSFYDETNKNLVAEIYKKDIETFKYNF